MKFKSNVDIEAALAVSQNATFAGNVTIGDNSASEIFLAFNSSATDFALGANGSNFMIGTSSDLDSGNLITLSGTNGRLGIGTTSPSEKLDVVGNIELGDGGTGAALKYNSTNRGTILVNGSEIMRLEAAGNVGIGTTSPQAALHVAGAFNSTAPTGNGVLMGFYSSSHGYIQLNGPSGGYIDFSTSGTDHKGRLLYDNTSNYMRFDTNGSEKMRIDSAGNVGIGTTSPAYKLDINGDFRVKDGSSAIAFNEYSNGATIWLDGSNGDFAGGDYFNISAYGTTDLAFGYAAGTKITMKSDGKLGIGTTSPSTALEVIGDIKIKQASNYSNYSLIDASEALLTLSTYTVNASAYPADIKFSPNQTERMRITDDGNVGIGTTSPNSKLDIRRSGSGVALELHQTSGSANDFVDLKMIAGSTSAGTLGTILRHKRDGTGGGDFSILTNPSLAGTPTEKLIVKSSGNVGIGNAAPAQRLHVAGNQVRLDTAAGGYYLHNGSGTFRGAFHDNGTVTSIYADGNGSTAAISIDSNNSTFAGDVSLADSKKLKFGAGNDLQIYHGGGNSDRIESLSSYLILEASNLILRNNGGTEDYAKFVGNGGVELYHNNSKKFETASTGVTVTGKISGLTAGTANTDAVNVQQLNNATTGTLIYKGTWSAAPTTTSVLDGAVSGGTIVIDAVNPGISVGATITGTGISGTVTVSNIAADGITIAISSSQTIADGTTLTFTTVGGTPDLSQASRKVTGHYYICETAGAVTPNGAGTTPNEWAVGDWATFSDLTTDAWQKIDNSSVLSGAGTGGKVPVWSGTGTSVTLADAPITVSGNNATFAGNVAMATGNATGKFAVKSTGVHASYDFYNNGTSYFNGGVVVDAGLSQTGGADVTFTGTVDTPQLKVYPSSSSDTSGTATIELGVGSTKYWSLRQAATAEGDLVIDRTYSSANTEAFRIVRSTGNATFAGDVSLTGGSLSISGDGSNAVTFTETGAGKMTVSAADDIILDAGSDIVLDAGGDDLRLKVSGTEYAKFNNSSSNLNIFSSIQDKAIKFIGNDNGTEITALTLNMADGGDATFAGNITFGDSHTIGDDSDDNLVIASSANENIIIDSADDIILDAAGNDVLFKDAGTHIGTINMSSSNLTIESSVSDKDIIFKGKDGASAITALTLDMSNGGSATFVDDIDLGGKITQTGTGNNTFGGKVSVGGGDTSTAQVALKGQQSLLSFVRGTSGDAQFFMSSDSSRLYFSHTDIQSTNLILTLNQDKTATFAGNVTLSSTAPVLYLANTTSSTGKTWYFSSAPNGNAYITQDGVIDALRFNHTTGNAIFGGYVNTSLVYGTTDLNLGYAGGTSGIFIKGSTATAGNVGIGTTAPKSKLQVAGGIQMAGDTAAASADKVGTMRYRTGTEYVEVNGTNIVTNGDFAADSNWTKVGNVAIASGVATFDDSGSNTNSYLQQDALTANKKYLIALEVKRYVAGRIQILAGTDVYSVNISQGVGSYSIYTSTVGSAVLRIKRDGSYANFDFDIDNVSVIEVTAEDASYADMCMQTGSSTYEWVNIVRNTY